MMPKGCGCHVAVTAVHVAMVIVIVPLATVGVVGQRDPAFDCAWRHTALAFAKHIQPFRHDSEFGSIHDGLQLSVLCNVSFHAGAAKHTDVNYHTSTRDRPIYDTNTLDPQSVLRPKRSHLAAQTCAIHVCPRTGEDSHTGTADSPVQSIKRAVALCRLKNTGEQPPSFCSILLHKGIHRLNETVRLTSDDSGLTIAPLNASEKVTITAST